MIDLDATAQAIVASAYKKISWIFDITTTSPATYRWSTVSRNYGGNAYSFKIIPESFRGVGFSRHNAIQGLVIVENISFKAANKNNSLDASDFSDSTVVIRQLTSDGTNEAVTVGVKMHVKTCEAGDQELFFNCEDILLQKLQGDYPNTRRIKDIFPSDDTVIDDGLCVPVILGPAVIPLRSIFKYQSVSYTVSTISFTASANGSRCKISDSAGTFPYIEHQRFLAITGALESENIGSFKVLYADANDIEFEITAGMVTEAAGASITIKQGQRYYLLGSTVPTWTISDMRPPAQYGRKTVWESASYDFNQFTISDDEAVNWRVFQPIIFDEDNDGTADFMGLFRSGQFFEDIVATVSRSDTVSTTNPADWLEYVLEDFGMDSDDLNSGELSSWKALGAACDGFLLDGIAVDGIGLDGPDDAKLEMAGGWWSKQPRKTVLGELLMQAHASLVNNQQIEAQRITATPVKTLLGADILQDEQGEATFTRNTIERADLTDTAYASWTPDGEPMNRKRSDIVSAKGYRTAISNDTLMCPHLHDSISVQQVVKLALQRRYLAESTAKLTTKHTCVAVRPEDVIRINSTRVGGTYDLLVDNMLISADGPIELNCTKHSDTLDNLEDLSPTAITIRDDDSARYLEPTLGGPPSGEAIGASRVEVFSRKNLIVGPNTMRGEFTDHREALNALLQSRHSGIYTLDGIYALTEPLYFPDRNVDWLGESEDGVIFQNNAGDEAFVLHNLTKKYRFFNFSIASQNAGNTTDSLIKIYGDTAPENTAVVYLEKIAMTLKDTGGWATATGDRGIFYDTGSGRLKVVDVSFLDGTYGVRVEDCEKVVIRDCYGEGSKLADVSIKNTDDCEVTGHTSAGFWCRCITIFNDATSSRGEVSGLKAVGAANNGTGEFQYGVQLADVVGYQVTNNKVKIVNTTTGGAFCCIGYVFVDGVGITGEGNHLEMDLADDSGAMGIFAQDVVDSAFIGNVLKIDNSDHTTTKYGAYLSAQSDRNIVAGNNINMVNNNAQEVGIVMNANTNDNNGSDNITYNVGTSVNDVSGLNNVTARDV